jgi:hypothetical protein
LGLNCNKKPKSVKAARFEGLGELTVILLLLDPMDTRDYDISQTYLLHSTLKTKWIPYIEDLLSLSLLDIFHLND